MSRRNSLLIFAVGISLLTFSMWNFEKSLFHYKIERIETFQSYDSISTVESYGKPIYIHPNKGVGPTHAPYELVIRIEYKNANGTLHIEDYYSDFGSVGYQTTHKLDERNVTGNGTTTFVTTHNYVGVHVLVFTPDYDPSARATEIWIYTIHYEPTLEKELIFFSLASSFVGTLIAAIGVALYSCRNKY